MAVKFSASWRLCVEDLILFNAKVRSKNLNQVFAAVLRVLRACVVLNSLSSCR